MKKMPTFVSPLFHVPDDEIDEAIDDFERTITKGMLKHVPDIRAKAGHMFPIKEGTKFTRIGKHVHPTWKKFFTRPTMELNAKLFVTYLIADSHGVEVIPDRKDVFRAFHSDPKETKVVIFGQDPYPNKVNDVPVAMGLSFATRDEKQPPSLRNIFRAIEEGTGAPMANQKDFTLSGWTAQGVMLLNYNLFFYHDLAKEEKQCRDLPIWSGFMEQVIAKIEEENPNVVFLLLGGFAQKLEKNIKSRVVKFTHPSPMSRVQFTYEPLAEVNEILKKKDMEPIVWNQNVL